MARNRSLALGIALTGLSIGWLTGAQPAHAQGTYPDKTIKLVVPFGPGGPTDVAARIAAQILQSALGQSVVIENRPGAGGATGSRSVATADPDGYTLLLGTAATLGVVPVLSKSAGYDPVKSFAAVAKLTDSTTVLISPVTFAPESLKDFIAHAKANPGKLNYASAGVGNITQLNAELLKSKAGIDVVHVPFKSGAEMVTAILSSNVHMAFADVSILLPLVQERKVKALAVTRAHRHPSLPQTPTMVEHGFADFVTPFWTGVHAPAGTPAPIVAKINAVLNEGLKSDAVKETLGKVGSEPTPLSPQDYSAFIVAEAAKWSSVVKVAGITPE